MEPSKRSKLTKKSRSFLLTLNQPERFEELKNYLLSLSGLKYAIAGKERAPTTDHEHIHIYVNYSYQKRLCIEKLEGSHVDKCYGTPQQNYKYVSKGGEIIWETGTLPIKGFLSIKEVEKMTAEERKNLSLHYFSTVERINLKEVTCLKTNILYKPTKVYYISGRSGIGKTQFAKYLIGDEEFNLVKFENGFWMGVTPHVKVALYDDWRDSHMVASEFLHFIDYNSQILNVKGGFQLNKYRLIIITSIMNLSDIYQDAPEESREQWERRVKVIHLSTVYNDDRAKHIRYLIISFIKYLKIYIYKLIKLYTYKTNEHK